RLRPPFRRIGKVDLRIRASCEPLQFRRCLSVTGVVKSALAGTRLSCREDADLFFVMLFLVCVNYEQDRDASGAADCMPAGVRVFASIFCTEAFPIKASDYAAKWRNRVAQQRLRCQFQSRAALGLRPRPFELRPIISGE